MTDELDPERLRRLTEAAVALPRSIEPTRDAWPAIRGRIEAGRVRAIASPAPPARPASPWRAGRLAAAAVLLVVASSGLTALLLRERRAKAAIVVEQPREAPGLPAETGVTPPIAGLPAPRVWPAGGTPIDAVFARYDAAAADLAAELDARRTRLDAGTVAVLDSCLRKIDAAIAEARAALRREPRNAVLTQLLTVSYRQKLDLLKRAADLPTGSFQD